MRMRIRWRSAVCLAVMQRLVLVWSGDVHTGMYRSTEFVRHSRSYVIPFSPLSCLRQRRLPKYYIIVVFRAPTKLFHSAFRG